MTCRTVLLLGLWTLAAVQAARPAALAEVPSPSVPPLRYRRVFVPQEHLTQHTRGYFPIKRDVFGTLLAEIEERSRAASQAAVWIESAEYRAVYAEGQWVSGQAVLRITHTAAEPAVLSLAPWGLAAGAGSWHVGDTTLPATLGTDAAGHLLVVVPASGELHVPWTLRGAADEWGESRFDMSLAAAPLSRLVLDVPGDLRVSVDPGVVTPPAAVAGAAAPAAGTIAMQRWGVQLGGHTRCLLTVASRQLDNRRQQLVSVQQDTTYRLADSALEMACDMGLEIHREPLAELRLDVDPEVQVTAVRLGNVDVNWSAVPSDDGRVQTVRVQFAERLTGVHSTLQVLAVSPLHTDTSWRLPALRPQGAFWRQGTMSLVVPETLELRHLAAIDARQSAVSPVTNGSSAERLEFELFGVEGALELHVTRRARGIVAEVGTTVDVGSGTVSAQTLADLRCRFGERCVVEAQVPNAWTIDGIDAEPADALHDYQVVAYEAEHRRLQIQLVRPLTADTSTRLIIRAHRTPTFPLTMDDVRPVEFLDTTYAARLVSVAPEANYRLELEGDSQLDRRDPAALGAADAGRMPPRTGGLVLVDDARARQLRMQISREDPEFAAAVYVDVEVDQLSYGESYRIICTPDSTPVTRLRVHLSETRPTDPTWQFIGDGNAVLGAQRVSDEQGATGLQRTGETWEIELRRPQGTPFELRGQRTTRTSDKLAISLATLPAAVSHEGRLTIRSTDGTRLTMQASAVKPIVSEPPPPGSYPTSRACYRFDASRNAGVVIDRVPAPGDGATLWAWDYRLTSQYLATGEVIHEATLLLESAGGTELRVRPPAGCTLRGLEINGLDASRSLDAAADGAPTITLPTGCRFPRVELTYDECGPPLGLRQRLATAFPQLDIPILDRRWSVWLPPGYRPVGASGDHTLAADELPSWRRRLLGPLAVRAETRPFRLFSRADWSWTRREPELAGTGHGPAQEVLHSLGERMLATAADPRREETTWRELLEQHSAHRANAAGVPEIWVDASWLAAEGWSLDRVLPPSAGETPVEAATALLSAARLVLVVHGEIVFLTSWDGLARYPTTWDTTANASTVVARPNSRLAHDLGTLPGRALPGVVPLPAWVGTPACPNPPWTGQWEAIRSGIAGHAWRLCEPPVDDAGCGTLVVEQSQLLGVIGWSLLLALAGIVGGWGWYMRSYWYPALLLAAVVALCAPVGWVPITSFLCPGILLGIGLAGIRRLQEAGRAVPGAARTELSAARANVVTVVLLVTGLVGFPIRDGRAAQPPDAVEADGAGSVYPVVVPVDEQLVPVGQYDYLPLAFYDALHLRASQAGAAQNDWFLRQATYRAVFSWGSQRTTLDLTALTAVYQLDVSRVHGRVEFPWGGQVGGGELLEARLDGQPIELDWNVARTALLMRVPGTGTYQLELVLRPLTREEPGERSLRFAIPSVAQSRLRVEVPFGAPDVQVPSAVGSSYFDPESGVQHTELGPVTELALRWPSGVAEHTLPQPMNVQQLLWLKVHPKDQPDAVVLESKFRVQSATRPVEGITLRVDARLRLLADPAARTYQWTEVPGVDPGESLVTLRLNAPVENEWTLHLRFHLTNTTGLGNVSLPRLESVEGRATRRWLAVSVSPDIEYTAGMSDLFDPLDAAEFLTMWGEAESAPNLCYRVSAEDPGWSLATRSRQPRSESRQTVDLSFSRAGIQFSLDAEIDTTNGEVYQHRLTIPRDFQVATVVVTAQDMDVAKAVEHDGSGTVTVFLRRGVLGQQRLSLRGFLPLADTPSATPTPTPTPMPLPSVTLTDVAVRSHTVRLYRQPDMWVDVQAPAGLKRLLPTPEGMLHPSHGRFLTAFELTEEGLSNIAGVTVSLRPNEPRVSARLVTTLRRTGDQWEAIADFDARVASESGGVADQFRWEIPPEWTGPFTFEPNVPYEIATIPGQRPQLIIRPWSPVTDRIQLRVRGPLKLVANERGRTPNILPLDTVSTERFFVLPTQLDQQRVDWETPGLVEVPLADVVPAGAADAATQVAYRVWSKPRAVIADVQRVAGQRRISLADVYVDCQASGRCYGLVTFAVEPAGTAHCTLEVPAEFELVQASIDSVPVALVLLADRRWQLRLASEQLPQQLTVVFRGQLAPLEGNRTRAMAVPWITDMTVARTLWTVRGPVGGTLRVRDGDPHGVSAVQQEMRRLNTTASLVASAANVVLDSPARDIQAWYTPWAVRLACAGARISYQGWPDQPAESERRAGVVAAVLRDQQAIAQRLKASHTVMDFVRETVRHAQTCDVWGFTGRAAAETAHYDFAGPLPVAGLSWQTDARSSWWPGFWAAVVIVVLGAGAHVLSTRGVLYLWWRRWPAAVGVAVGILWWLLVWPSLLGWVIVGASLWAALRVPLSAQRLPAGTPDNRLEPHSHR